MTTSLEQRKALYQKVFIQHNQQQLRKFRADTNDYYCKYEEELINLIERIPNWQTYLTDKQLKITQLYISFRNTSAIDTHLKLTTGVAYHTLFGSIKENKCVGGVFKKLKTIDDKLKQLKIRKGGK